MVIKMLKNAVVLKILDENTAEISVVRETACGKNCMSCGGCGGKASVIIARAKNTCGAQVGDHVTLETDTSSILGLAAVVYLLPLVLFFIGYFAVYSFTDLEWARILTGAFGFISGFLVSRIINKHIRKNGGIEFSIISID